ncbi:MAG: fumarylacetoacetate hydrolase family protein [Acidobacteria bacterium]|nr:fumarylacetoacetate hydrolase family protein [Acidobacteriota bacterium]
MRLLNFHTAPGRARLGLVENGVVLDLTALAGADERFRSVVSLIADGPPALERARALADRHRSDAARWAALDGCEHAPLIGSAQRVFAVGLNYADHAAENNLPIPDAPVFFTKLASGVVPAGRAIPLPACSQQVDYEAELAVMIGRRVRHASEAAARECIAGYTILNDVTARDLQIQHSQWFRGKNCDGFAPLGPWLVTADEVRDPDDLDITLRLNGRERQRSNSRNLIFKPPALIAFLSRTLTLEPGDIITTGTPAGVGFHGKPPVFLQPGDVVEVEVSGVGVLRNPVVCEET